MLKAFLVLNMVALPFLAWPTGSQRINQVDIGPLGVQFINDPDLNLEEESLQIVLDLDEVLAVCTYTLRNQSIVNKVLNLTFNIPITADQITQEAVGKFLISYGINLNDQPTDFRTIYHQNSDKNQLVVQKISQIRITPRTRVKIQVLFRIYAGLDQNNKVSAEDRPMRFKYMFFQNRGSRGNNLRRIHLTLDKTPILQNQGVIRSIEGIPLRDDPRQRILLYSANDFNVLNNPALIINYSIKGYFPTQ